MPVQKPPALTLTVSELPRLVTTRSRTRRRGLLRMTLPVPDMSDPRTWDLISLSVRFQVFGNAAVGE